MNFYWKDEDRELIESHIGKLQYIGQYCESCGIILNTLGTQFANQERLFFQNGTSIQNVQLPKCPRCKESSNKVLVPAYSFIWIGMFQKQKVESFKKQKQKLIVSDDNEEFTIKEFLTILEPVKVEYQHYTIFR